MRAGLAGPLSDRWSNSVCWGKESQDWEDHWRQSRGGLLDCHIDRQRQRGNVPRVRILAVLVRIRWGTWKKLKLQEEEVAVVFLAVGLIVVGRLILWAAEGGKRRETEPATVPQGYLGSSMRVRGPCSILVRNYIWFPRNAVDLVNAAARPFMLKIPVGESENRRISINFWFELFILPALSQPLGSQW